MHGPNGVRKMNFIASYTYSVANISVHIVNVCMLSDRNVSMANKASAQQLVPPNLFLITFGVVVDANRSRLLFLL